MTECHKCGRSGIKLWRCSGGYPYQGQLLCNRHLETAGEGWPEHRRGPGVSSNTTISYVPAIVITGSEDSNEKVMFYPITDVPEKAANAWNALPE